jgi:hypothetical protein
MQRFLEVTSIGRKEVESGHSGSVVRDEGGPKVVRVEVMVGERDGGGEQVAGKRSRSSCC